LRHRGPHFEADPEFSGSLVFGKSNLRQFYQGRSQNAGSQAAQRVALSHDRTALISLTNETRSRKARRGLQVALLYIRQVKRLPFW
jgi:hypothetical protein